MPTDEDADPRGFRPARCLGCKSTVPNSRNETSYD